MRIATNVSKDGIVQVQMLNQYSDEGRPFMQKLCLIWRLILRTLQAVREIRGFEEFLTKAGWQRCCCEVN